MSDALAEPLHALLDRLQLGERRAARGGWSFPLGSMQPLNDRLAGRPLASFVNATLRGVGQVMFVNNPISGALALAAWPGRLRFRLGRREAGSWPANAHGG